jgi:hypothetical protein
MLDDSLEIFDAYDNVQHIFDIKLAEFRGINGDRRM